MADLDRTIMLLEEVRDCESIVMQERVDAVDEAIRLLRKLKEQKRYESRAMLPCVCGSKRRGHRYGRGEEQLVCDRCGLAAPAGKTGIQAIRNWNAMIETMQKGKVSE